MPKLNPNIVTLLFPAKCIGCENELVDVSLSARNAGTSTKHQSPTAARIPNGLSEMFDSHWCQPCWRQLCDGEAQRCLKCSAQISANNPLGDRCAVCRGLDLRFATATSIGNYAGLLQELVIRMKNQHDEQLAIQLGYLLALQISRAEFVDELSLVIPVPTHWWRRFERGFHGAEVIAETVAKTCRLPYSRRVARCLRSTKKQGTLTTAGRFNNVKGAFGILPKSNVNGLTILLIDDVLTSGATASELARLMLKAGAAKVYVGVIARGARVS